MIGSSGALAVTTLFGAAALVGVRGICLTTGATDGAGGGVSVFTGCFANKVDSRGCPGVFFVMTGAVMTGALKILSGIRTVADGSISGVSVAHPLNPKQTSTNPTVLRARM
jgi:hypothetical protein